MIKNIIFDLGNVLISFKPSEYLIKCKYPETIRNTILSDIFSSEEWLSLDKGEITTQEAIHSIEKKSSLTKDEIAHIFNLRTEMMFPLDPNVKLLPELRKRGFRLYYLSNFPLDIFDEIKSGYYFFKHFDGGLISAEVKYSKPEREFYEILMEKYSIKPEECLFIDDIEINVKAAESYGMKGLVTYGSVGIYREIEKALENSSKQ
jgi:epoxide hydrolase-like predicted phosphatase